MDDAWPARWPPPLPAPAPPPPRWPLPLPAPAPPPPPPRPSQMDSINLRYLFRSFAGQEAVAGGRAAAVPQQLVANPSSSQSGLPAKAVPSNSLLAHVPGNYLHVNHVPDLKALFDRPNASNAAGTIDLTRASPLSSTAPLPKYPRHGLSASSSVEQSSLGALFLNKSVNAQGTFPGEGSAKDGISHGTIQFQDSSSHTIQKLPSKSFPCHHPALLGDRIRVSCLNVGGEFFVGEAGLFGVLCLCHRLRMSVAKFCEHAGGPTEKAGEIVHMENGMSITQWFKYCIGVGASTADTKWDWPEWDCMDSSTEEYRLKNLLTRNSSTGKMALLSGYGKITGPINKPVYSNDLCNEGGWCTSVEKLVNKPDETYYGKSVDTHEAFTKNSALQQNSEINLGFAKNHTIHAVNPNPISRPSGSPYFTANMGGNHNGNHLAHSYANLLEKNFDASFRIPGPSSTGVLSYDSRACRFDFPQKIFQDSLGSASNTDLKLGQSSYHQSTATLFPLVQSTIIDFQKSQSHLPSIIQNPCPKQTSKVNKSIEEHAEPPFGTRNKKQSLEVANGINRSEDDELTDDAAKNSFISLFLSHLERSSTSESIDDILNSNEHYLPKALDVACSSDHSKIASRQVEPRANNNNSKLAPTIIHTKRRSDDRSLAVPSSGYIPQNVPQSNSQETLIHGDWLSHLLPSQPNAGITKICAGVSCPANCRSCNHVADKSHQVAQAETGVPCLYDKMARGHSTFACVDDVCTHKNLRAFAKIGCQCGKACFGQNDQSTLGKSIHGCCCIIQEDISKLGFRAGHLCRTHFSNDGAPILAHEPTVEGLDERCTCSTLIPRSSLCCREHILQSSCHAWPIDGFHYRSSMGDATNSLTKNTLLDASNKKEPGPCWDGRYCYPVVPKCLAGCGFTKHCDVRIGKRDRTVPKGKHDVQIPARCCTLGESEKLICPCSSNIIARRSNSQASFWKDVSNKVMNQPYVPIPERLKNVSEASVAGGSWPYGAVTEKKGACRHSGISKEQLKSSFSSGSSSAVVTKFSASPEFNNMSSCAAKYGVEHKKVFDEGSRIEKCSSSSYVPISTGCEEALNGFSRFHLDPSKVKRKCNQISDGSTPKENDEEQCFQMPKKSRTLRCSAKHSESDNCTRKISFQSSQKGDSQPQKEASSFSCRVSKNKRKHATMHLNKPVKRLHSHHKILKGDYGQSDDKGILLGELSYSDRKKKVEDMTTLDRTKHQQEGSRVFVRKLPKFVSLNCIVNEPNSEGACSGSASVDSSLIATGITNDNRKSPKIVPLNLVLEKAKRCHAVKPLCKTENIHFSEEKSSDRSVDKSSFGNENCSPQAENEMQSSKKNSYSSNAFRPHAEADCNSPCSDLGEGEPIGLTDVETSQLSISASRCTGVKNRRASVSLNRIKSCEEFATGSACNPHGDKDNAVRACEVNVGRYKERLSSDASCCVCGISNLEPCNQLIECSKCYIKVHQACYGVLKLPRGQWFCRPCMTNTQDTVCVLCGYGGGAMTRALKAQNILKSLLKGLTIAARSEKYIHSSGNASNECSSNVHGEDIKHDSFYARRSTSLNTVSTIDLQKPIDIAHEENTVSNSWTTNHNSSLLGPRRMQWVHVVCGLWTPGTKCPNATTMSAFDVSGASPAKRNTACSMCNRTGGSFMECRDVNCSVLFHPWCAHQRGLLQSEPEGEHNENVGFYGRCLDHAILDYPKKECLTSNDRTCARTEGLKGRKGEGWSGANYKKPEENSGECSVSQEQINAWLRINGSKSCIRGQKEYIHYKQLKGWKHLVVYKSGIHGLGLYTSEFIPRGSMVVEYVGEIVGQRVADKREIEYQSGKQQYESACYFFKIDKEHIIDATRKGGIARFINHSCLPNCVAKIISVRNEKKVVFFAERHINPGEEITYDYHFNREDDGQRIPCFCRSKSCRRYLN